ncbi:MAG TPA: hypothetical protein VN605_03925, partial [Thermoanaerobaculia bacterium]|nr:hypothetical protein [Thermoanaerobaculia bacterium]
MSSRSLFPIALAALCLSTAFSAEAQQIRLGSLEGNSALFSSSSLLIDWTRSANASGTVNTASIGWVNATSPCNNIFYVRFYAIPSNALVSVMTAERGPFRAVNGINTVALEPPVSVTSDTFIAVRRAAGAESCGQPYGTFTRQPGRALLTNDDFKGGPLTLLGPAANFRLQAQASNVPSIRVSTIPVVGAAAGALGSFFR